MKYPKSYSTSLLTVIVLGLAFASHAQLQYGFYNGKCGTNNVESIIRDTVSPWFNSDRKIVAGLLRLQFHDCFINGCDASILLDGPGSEKSAPQNAFLFGFNLIDQIKSRLESVCPGVVSCADILIAATRDATVLAGGAPFQVQTGRKDRVGPAPPQLIGTLPGPGVTAQNAIQIFRGKGFSTYETVVLLGAHTVGVQHTGQNSFVTLDEASSALTVDNSYYRYILNNRGVLGVDQSLAQDGATSGIVQSLANSNRFTTDFGQALVKLGALDVITGNQGEIRRVCTRTN